MFRSTFAALVVVGASLPVFAQSGLGDISQSCQNAFLNILGDKEASTCLNANGLISAAGKTGANDSLVQPVTDWATGMCAAGPCSNSTLEALVRNVTSGCSAELSKAGLSTSNAGDLVGYVQLGYPTVRKVLCLKDNDAGKLCVNEDLSAIETAMGKPLSITNIIGLATNVSVLTSLPKDKICSSCNKAVYATVKQDFPSLVSSSVDSMVSSQCGSDFVNGQMPSNIQQTAAQGSKSTESKDKDGASGLAVSGVIGALSAVGVLSALAVF
jgi:hypothetical protein